MIYMRNWHKKLLMGCIAGSLVLACSDSKSSAEEPPLPPKEEGKVILEKFGDIRVYPGNQRIKVEYKYTDSRAKNCEVSWITGGEKKSTSVPMSPSQGEIPNEFYITNLEESTLTFSFIAYSEDKKQSSPKWTGTPVSIYGSKYISALKNPAITQIEWNPVSYVLHFNWTEHFKDVVRYLLKYTNVNGEQKEVSFKPDESKAVTLQEFPPNGKLEVTTVYLPNGAIDEVSATPTQMTVNTAGEESEPWNLKMEMQASASLTGWQAVDAYMKKYDFEYTEHPNNGGGKDHNEDTHIEVIEDKGLGQWVFKFNSHASGDGEGNIVVLDGDRGTKNDRMRNEMKSRTGDGRYHMNGNWEEWQRLEWKFKIPRGFRPTKSFTHIHQLKAQEGNNGSPLITITPRASDTNGKNSRIQVIHTGDNSETTKGTIIDNIPLSDFEDEWIQVTTEMFYSHHGSFYIKMERLSDSKVIVEKQFSDIDMWRKGATNIRNKFGIYRSYGGKLEEDFKGKFPTSGIKDECLYLADFKIYEKGTNPHPQPHD